MEPKLNYKEIAIDFHDITFGYIENMPIVKKMNFQIEKGQYICLIGHNGSGKSTVSKLLMGLAKPWSGSIKIFGKVLNLDTLKEILNQMGLIFQNPDNQFIGLTAEDDIAFGLENRKVPRNVIFKIIEDVAEIMEIKNLLSKNAAELSGGEKQKVAISSILAINPDIIIFDESTSMLDTFSKEEIKLLMHDLSKFHKKTVISITHDMEEIVNCDEVIVLKEGTIIARQNPLELFQNPKLLVEAKLDLPFNIHLGFELNKLGFSVKYTNDLNDIMQSLIKK